MTETRLAGKTKIKTSDRLPPLLDLRVLKVLKSEAGHGGRGVGVMRGLAGWCLGCVRQGAAGQDLLRGEKIKNHKSSPEKSINFHVFKMRR
ncbi:hypothetical protein E2C01_017612 [Portunus trituberculatus]|uniref:Uncharacterized protein n=1 Tax=Portunus trituberculatus TaxID=210409 RepID=A0A5B7DTZ5_PORTR|nr:hypothetical protein [Portunus trituberculatus]